MNKTLNLAWPIVATFLIIMGWMPFEGLLWLVTSVGISLALLWGWVVYRQTSFLSGLGPLGRTSVFGAIIGLATPLLILGLMVLKTGVHAHGPEYSPAEIAWITQQITIWPFVGGLAGFGLASIGRSLRTQNEQH